jgi:hypothetical protein
MMPACSLVGYIRKRDTPPYWRHNDGMVKFTLVSPKTYTNG